MYMYITAYVDNAQWLSIKVEGGAWYCDRREYSTPVSFTNRTAPNDITEILLKVALYTLNPNPLQSTSSDSLCRNKYPLHIYIVCWYKTLYYVEFVLWTRITTIRNQWVVMRFVHTTGKIFFEAKVATYFLTYFVWKVIISFCFR